MYPTKANAHSAIWSKWLSGNLLGLTSNIIIYLDLNCGVFPVNFGDDNTYLSSLKLLLNDLLSSQIHWRLFCRGSSQWISSFIAINECTVKRWMLMESYQRSIKLPSWWVYALLDLLVINFHRTWISPIIAHRSVGVRTPQSMSGLFLVPLLQCALLTATLFASYESEYSVLSTCSASIARYK